MMATRARSKGLFIAVEGVTGSGKTFVTKRLVDALETAKLPVTRIGGFQRKPEDDRARLTLLLYQMTKISRFIGLPWLCETSLLFAEQSYNLDVHVVPAYDRGRIVIYENYDDALTAYQVVRGAMLRLDHRIVDGFLRLLIESERTFRYPVPDLTLYVESSVPTIIRRLTKRDKKAPLTSADKNLIRLVLKAYDDLYTARTVLRIPNVHDDDVHDALPEVVEKITAAYRRRTTAKRR